MADPSTYRPAPGEIPTSPGVYRFLDAEGRVIYVGKAKNLRARLSSYFQDIAALHPRTQTMVTTACAVEWTVVSTEVESLALEYSWIKELNPRFNVMYKDDKSYPYLAVTMQETFPRVQVMRGARRRGARYFGPYVAVWSIRETVDQLLRVFPVRSCSAGVFKRAQAAGRPCLLGYIDKCSAPCVGRVSEQDHRALAEDFCSFMAGRTGPYLREVESQMRAAAAALDFEKAARLRDDAAALRKVIETNAVVLPDATDADVFALVRDELEAAVQVFHVRGGRVRGQRGWVVDLVDSPEDAELMERLLQQVYSALPDPADEQVGAQASDHTDGQTDERDAPGSPDSADTAGAAGGPAGAGSAAAATAVSAAGAASASSPEESAGAGGTFPGTGAPATSGPTTSVGVGPRAPSSPQPRATSRQASQQGRGAGRREAAATSVDDVAHTATTAVPREILVSVMPSGPAAVAAWLTQLRGARVEVRVPRRGDKASLMETVRRNAEETLRLHKTRRAGDLTQRSQALEELAQALDLPEAPLRIECYDVSHTQGSYQVGSMVVFEDGAPRKSDYRRFTVRGSDGQGAADDTAAMHEVLTRRFRRLLAEQGGARGPGHAADASAGDSLESSVDGSAEDAGGGPEGGVENPGTGSLSVLVPDGRGGQVPAPLDADGVPVVSGPVDPSTGRARRFSYLPGLVVVDGGPPQVSAARAVLDELGVDVPLVGLAKRLEEVWVPGEEFPLVLPRSSAALYMLQHLRDESHRFAITHHRSRRSKGMTRSVLDEIPGLGPARQAALLRDLGSVKQIRQATPERLAQVKGIGPALAQAVIAHLNGAASQAGSPGGDGEGAGGAGERPATGPAGPAAVRGAAR